jgi:glucose-1-phosphate thymidylyltransferase
MKGIILADGSCLYPLTKVMNKHLLAVYDIPIIIYPLQVSLVPNGTISSLFQSGAISDIFLKLLGS